MDESLMNKLRNLLAHYLRNFYSSWRRARLTCGAPTILSRDCTGGILCHDLGLQFRSPTVNLSMPPEDFIIFCQYLPAFLAAEVQEAAERQMSFPVGRLSTDHGSITLYFVHYESFLEAKEAWNRRRGRVDRNNMRVILHVPPSQLTTQLLDDFELLPYEHKVLLSYGIDTKKHPHGYNLPIYKTGSTPSINRYHTPYAVKRYMDDFNWVAFLNGK